MHCITLPNHIKLAVDDLCKLDRINDLAILVNSHVTGCDLVDENNFTVVVTELELDVPKVKAASLEVVSNDLCDLEGLILEALEHFSSHNLKSYETFACNERVALSVVLESALT